MNFFFKRNNRLTSFDIKNAFNVGKRLFLGKAIIILSKNRLSYSRLAVITLKKEFKHAVSRNSQKRIVRNWFRYNQEDLSGFDIIFLLKKGFTLDLKDPKGEKIVKFAKTLFNDN